MDINYATWLKKIGSKAMEAYGDIGRIVTTGKELKPTHPKLPKEPKKHVEPQTIEGQSQKDRTVAARMHQEALSKYESSMDEYADAMEDYKIERGIYQQEIESVKVNRSKL